MSLLLDALNRAQKNKDNDKNPLEAVNENFSDKAKIKAPNTINTIDLEGLDLGESKAANSEDDLMEVDLPNDGKQEKADDANAVNNKTLSTGSEKYDLLDNPEADGADLNSRDVSTENGPLEFFVEAQKTNINDNDQSDLEKLSKEPVMASSFDELSLEDIPQKQPVKPSDLMDLFDAEFESHKPVEKAKDEVQSIKPSNTEEQPVERHLGDENDQKNSDHTQAKLELEEQNETSINSLSDEKLTAESTVVQSPVSKSIDIKKIRKARKVRKIIITTTTAISASVAIAFAGYYYYNGQIENLSMGPSGSLSTAQFSGRSLTPPGAVPTENTTLENPSEQSQVISVKAETQNTGKIEGVVTDIVKKSVKEKHIVAKEKVFVERIIVTPKKETSKHTLVQSETKQTVETKTKNDVKRAAPINFSKVEQTTTKQNKEIASLPFYRQKLADPIHPLLITAFNAFQIGDDNTARESYFEVLKLDKNNRDALLGLGAVAVRQKQLDLARNYYTRLLRRDQDDSVARGALVGLVGQMDPIKAETDLKLMLNKEPGAGYLHFALGNIYALQQRWLDAQSSFFNAYRIDADNADYAYNVAVSLDHIGERKTAVRYYQQALQYSQNKAVSFDLSQVKQRVQVLIQDSPERR